MNALRMLLGVLWLGITWSHAAGDVEDEIRRLSAAGNWEEAENVARRHLETVEAGGAKASEELGEALWLVGACLQGQVRYEEAQEFFVRRLAVAEAIGKDLSSAHRALADLYGRRRMFEEAREHGRSALEHLGEDAAPEDRIRVLQALAIFEGQSPELERADQYYVEILRLMEVLPEHQQIGIVRHYADYLRSANRVPDSVRLLERTLVGRRDKGQDLMYGVLKVQLAANLIQSDLAAAKEHIDEGLPVLKEFAEPRSIAMYRAYTAKAEVYGAMLDYEVSAENYRLALEAMDGVEPETSMISLSARQFWAMGLHRLGKWEDAEREYRKVVTLAEKHLGRGDTYCKAVQNLSALLLADRNFRPEEAIPLLETTLPYRRATTTLPGQLAHVLYNIVHACSGSGEYERAEPYARELEKFLAEQGSAIVPYMRNMCYFALVKQALHAERWKDARILSHRKEEAVRDRAREVMSFAPAAQRLSFQQEARPFCMLASTGEYRQLADALLRYKKLMLSSMMEEKKLHQASNLAEARPLQERLAGLQETFRAAEFLGRPEAELKGLSHEIKELQVRLSRMLKVDSLLGALDVTAKQVSDSLPEDTALVEFFAYSHWASRKHVSTGGYGAMIYQKGMEPRYQSLGTSENQEDWIWSYDRRIRYGADEEIEDRCKRLYDYIWRRVGEQLDPRIKRVVIGTDDLLASISFATLLQPDGSFLGEKYAFEYVSSGRDLLNEPLGAPERRAILVGNPDFKSGVSAAAGTRSAAPPELADFAKRSDLEALLAPLPGAEREARDLERTMRDWGWQTELWTSELPTEARLRNLRSPGILHLATHGFYIEKDTKRETMGIFDNPMYRAGLALVGADGTFRGWRGGTMAAPGGDGVLMADEVTALDLDRTWLVTLSACDTGRGYFYLAEGKFGLPRAFTQAGARNILTSLWPIPDEESAVFMGKFYARLHECGDPGRALAETQRERLQALRAKVGVGAAVRMVGGFTMRTAEGIR